MTIPKDLKFTENHEWIRVENGTAHVGITDFAQGELGELVYVELDQLDESLKIGDIFGSIEAVKTVSDVYMPVSGTIVAINEALEESPELINDSPYEEGWMVKIELSDLDELGLLMDAEAYQELIG